MIFSIYSTNKDVDENKNSDDSSANNALKMIDHYLDSMTLEKFVTNYENVIANLINISDSNLDQEKLNIIFKILNSVITFIDPILSNLERLNNLYKILDTIHKKCSENAGIKKIYFFFNFY